MNQDTEKALLEWIRVLAENASEYATDGRLVAGSRAYLATLWKNPNARDYQCPVCGCGTGNCTHAKPEPNNACGYKGGVCYCDRCMKPEPEPKRGVEHRLIAMLDMHSGVACGAGNPGCQCWHCRYGRDALRLYREERKQVARRIRDACELSPGPAFSACIALAEELERRDG